MKYLSIILIASIFMFGYKYEGSTLSAVALSGGIIKAKHIDPSSQKYKRKDCPVCKGKGWYISGDDITKVPCGYCEEETGSDSTVIHPPVIIKDTPSCTNPECKLKSRSVPILRK